MLRRFLIGAALALASSCLPLLADYSDLQPIVAAVENDRVTLQLANPTPGAEEARIRVEVKLDDGSIEVLTTAAVTVPGSGISTLTVPASGPIVEIIDDPQPISP